MSKKCGPMKRRVKGKSYTLWQVWPTREKAESNAAECRNVGARARVFKLASGYGVFVG